MRKRLFIGLSIAVLVAIVGLFLGLTVGLPGIGGTQPKVKIESFKPVYSDTSPPLSEMAAQVTSESGVPENDLAKARRLPDGTLEIIEEGTEIEAELPVVAGPAAAPQINLETTDSPDPVDASFEGVSADSMSAAAYNNLLVVAPPDPTGEAGTTQYFQWVNVAFQVFDKSTGASLLGPVAGNALWLGAAGTPPSPGGPTPICSTENHGDPIVTWDQLASRWVISQFSFVGTPGAAPYYQCIAVSATADALGPWHRYVFVVHPTYFHDYPKVSVWPDAYYMSANQFVSTPAGVGLLRGAGAWAFDRAKMLVGDPTATFNYFNVDLPNNSGVSSMLPSDIEGTKKVPNRPNFFVMADDVNNTLRLWEFRPNFANPALATFGIGSLPGTAGTPNQVIGAGAFASLCGNVRACVPQLGSPDNLDALSPRLMWRLIYRVFGRYEYMVASHTVNVLGENGVRWYILRRRLPTTTVPGETMWSIWQSGNYGGTDGIHRFMGSAAMDKFGNVAVGFSASSPTMFPEIRFNGRRFADDPDTFGLVEQILWAGEGSQTATSNRWGDYTHLSVDPVDDCTFWYTNQYTGNAALDTRPVIIPGPPPSIGIEPDPITTEDFDWRTRIGSFRFSDCPDPVSET